jgi:predicted regulator of Ras-like GTPase activity (Roadblock/LC7/MglB family)
MNCGRFRFLIQQRFDVEISSQDDHALLTHLETCESCQKFHHQVQQVILASEELPLPEELLPQKVEALARKIMEELPQPKKSLFGAIFGIFGGNKNGSPKSTPTRPPRESAFPHVHRGGSQPSQARKLSESEQEEAQAMQGRLKSFTKSPLSEPAESRIDSREAQSTTRSLGERFGAPQPTTNLLDDQPLTLADAIRRKNLESRSSQDISGPQQPATPPGSRQPTDWSAAIQPPTPQPFPASPATPPIASGGWAATSVPNTGFGAPQPPAKEGGSWNVFDAGAGANPHLPKDIQIPKSFTGQTSAAPPNQTKAEPWSDSWASAGPSTSNDPWQITQPQAPSPIPSGGWDQSVSKADAWGQPQGNEVPTDAPAHQGAEPWGPIVNQQPAVQPIQPSAPTDLNPASSWQSSASGVGSNFNPNSPAANRATTGGAPPQKPFAGLGSSSSPGSFGQAPQPNAGFDAPVTSPRPAPNTGTEGSDWGPAPQHGSWDAPEDFAENWVRKPEPEPEPDPGAPAKPILKMGIDEPVNPPTSPAGNAPPPSPWLPTGASAAQPPASGAAFGAASTAGSQPSLWEENPSFAAWEPSAAQPPRAAEPLPPQQNAWAPAPAAPLPSPTPGNDFWASSAPAAASTGAYTSTSGNFKPVTDWSSSAGGAPTTSTGSNPVAAPAMPSALPTPPAPGPGAPSPSWNSLDLSAKRPSWSLEAEQVETGTWKAYVPQESLGAPSKPPTPAKTNPGMPMPPTPTKAGGAAGALDKDDWDMPIQEKLARQRARAAEAEASETKPLGILPSAPTAPAPSQGTTGQPAATPAWANSLSNMANNFTQAASSDLGVGSAQTSSGGWSVPSSAPSPPAPAPASPSTAAPLGNIPDADLWGLDADDFGGVAASAASPAPGSNQGVGQTSFTQPAGTVPSMQNIADQATPPVSAAWGAPAPGPVPPAMPTTPNTTTAFAPLQTQESTGKFVSELAGSIPGSAPSAPLVPPVTPAPSGSDFAPPAGQPAPTPAATPQEKPPGAGLFHLDDRAMDTLFANLGVNERSVPAVPVPRQPSGSNPPAATPPPPTPAPPTNGAAPAPSGSWGAEPSPPTRSWQSSVDWPAIPDSQANLSTQWSAPQTVPSLSQPPQPASSSPSPSRYPPQAAPASGGTNSAPNWAPPPAPPQAPPPAPSITPAPVSSNYAAPPPPAPEPGRLFSIDDSIIDRIFADNLGIKDSQSQKASKGTGKVTQAVQQISEAAMAEPVLPPKIEGVGRLDSRPDTTSDVGSGRISSIGKFLLDGKDLEKIGKITSADLSDTTMRILTMEAAGELQTLLQHVGSQPGVVGSVIVGNDGLLIANTMPAEIDGEQVGVWSLAVYMNTQNAAKKLGNDRVYQIVSKTPRGYLIIADFGSGLLVTISDARETDALVQLMRIITQLVSS